MFVDQNFISDVVNNFHDVITARPDLCLAAKSELNLDAYKRKAFQELYALRYIPAYYFEYCVLANELNDRIANRNQPINVFSLGCGLSPDYYALRDNLDKCNFNYFGLDVVLWSSRQHMPAVGVNYSFIHKSVSNLNSNDICDADVFVFPKSIGDIRDSKEGALDVVANVISKTKKNSLFFLNSYITKEKNKPLDLAGFKVIHNALLAAGFTTSDDVDKTFYLNSKSEKGALISINNGFVYPDGKRVSCSKQSVKDPDCKECPVPKSPIFTNQFMSFHLMEYVRS